jgi:hypothetical protein
VFQPNLKKSTHCVWNQDWIWELHLREPAYWSPRCQLSPIFCLERPYECCGGVNFRCELFLSLQKWASLCSLPYAGSDWSMEVRQKLLLVVYELLRGRALFRRFQKGIDTHIQLQKKFLFLSCHSETSTCHFMTTTSSGTQQWLVLQYKASEDVMRCSAHSCRDALCTGTSEWHAHHADGFEHEDTKECFLVNEIHTQTVCSKKKDTKELLEVSEFARSKVQRWSWPRLLSSPRYYCVHHRLYP